MDTRENGIRLTVYGLRQTAPRGQTVDEMEFRLQATGYGLRATGYGLRATGYGLRATMARL
ncbi:hypothetical protein [Rhodohalobacter barkolensis]|uniref:hypothetical protein n=1 Tax=Rhodohalobacter barkolensis TaxID=2053187 RepID=UPI00105429DF|nr:hypothetical protein [Rhodohalobacter barkolensis]